MLHTVAICLQLLAHPAYATLIAPLAAMSASQSTEDTEDDEFDEDETGEVDEDIIIDDEINTNDDEGVTN